MSASVSYRHTTDGPGWPPIAAGADVAESVAVDRVAADSAVFDTEAATYYGNGVEHTENLKSEGDGDQHGCESVLHSSYSRSVRDGRSRPSDAGSEAAEALRTSPWERRLRNAVPDWTMGELRGEEGHLYLRSATSDALALEAEAVRRARLSRWQGQR